MRFKISISFGNRIWMNDIVYWLDSDEKIDNLNEGPPRLQQKIH